MVKGESKVYSYPCSSNVSCSHVEIALPKGLWRIECWGASGGGARNTYYGYDYYGGKGGYSTGQLFLKERTKLFLFIGGSGISNSGSSYSLFNGGYNGGGKGYNGHSYYYGGSGGGATDVRIGGTNLVNRIIVAGGGGGAFATNLDDSRFGPGGAGGGLNGIDGSLNNDYKDRDKNTKGRGGNQTHGGESASSTGGSSGEGIFGSGGNSGTSTQSSSGGGGGGYYGGSGGAAGGGGGGSGYVSPLLSKGVTIDGDSSFFSPYGTGNETGHQGNGVIRITCLGMLSNPKTRNQKLQLLFIN
jgi:hypothetical protein